MKNNRNHFTRQTLPGMIIIDSDSVYGNKFARMYINELCINLYDLFNDLDDKQLRSIIRRASKLSGRNTVSQNLIMKDALIQFSKMILDQRHKRRKY